MPIFNERSEVRDSANREQNKINLFIFFYAEVQPILSKDSASRENYQIYLSISEAMPIFNERSEVRDNII
jgi:hypothetical protein